MTDSSDRNRWTARPDRAGWYLLRHVHRGGVRLGFWRPGHGWRVADAIGRTVVRSEEQVARLFDPMGLLWQAD